MGWNELAESDELAESNGGRESGESHEWAESNRAYGLVMLPSL
jgi:hypothetical protein